jgi:hypothetical protein
LFFFVHIGDGHQYHGTHASESPSQNRSTKLNIEQPVINVSNPSSPQPARHLTPTPQPPAFINPFQQQQQQQQQVESNPPSKEDVQTNDEIAVGTLLDIMGDYTAPPQPAPPAPLTTTENDLFNLNINSQPTFSAPTDLLGVDFDSMPLNTPILHRNASETVLPVPLQATPNILKSETKSSSNQNINRLDPFGDLFGSSTTQKASSNESIASKQAAGK